jgi:hypothetical protein
MSEGKRPATSEFCTAVAENVDIERADWNNMA